MDKQFYIIDSSLLNDVFTKVIEAKKLIKTGQAENIVEATQMVGLSKSTFYKYKDSVFLMNNVDFTK